MERWRELQSKSAVQMSDAELAEFTETSMRGAYNASDLNRVTSAVTDVSSKLTQLGLQPYTQPIINDSMHSYDIYAINNMISNYSFETDLTGWLWGTGLSVLRFTQTTAYSDVGNGAAQLIASGSNSASSWDANIRYDFTFGNSANRVFLVSAFVQADALTDVKITLKCKVSLQATSSTNITYDAGYGCYRRVVALFTVPDDAPYPHELCFDVLSTSPTKTRGVYLTLDSVVLADITSIFPHSAITSDWVTDGKLTVCFKDDKPYLIARVDPNVETTKSYTWSNRNTRPDIPTAGQMMLYAENVKQIRSTLQLDRSLRVDSVEKLTYEGANNIEQVLALAYDYIDSQSRGMVYCGQTNLYSGGVFTN